MPYRGIHIKRLLLIILLVLSHEPAYAEWVVIEKNNQLSELQTVYVDPTTIRREGNLVTMWQLIDFQWRQGDVGMGPHQFFSTKTHKQFDCAAKRLRLLAFTEYYGDMVTGRAAAGYVYHDNWLPIEPESLNHALWEVACNTP